MASVVLPSVLLTFFTGLYFPVANWHLQKDSQSQNDTSTAGGRVRASSQIRRFSLALKEVESRISPGWAAYLAGLVSWSTARSSVVTVMQQLSCDTAFVQSGPRILLFYFSQYRQPDDNLTLLLRLLNQLHITMDPKNTMEETAACRDASNFLQEFNAPQSNQNIALSEVNLSQTTLLWSTYIIANALTLLGIGLSRRTKPWCFFLRVCYRIGRTNLKWTAFWLIWMLLSQLSATGSDFIMNSLLRSLSSFSDTRIGKHLQMSWAILLGQPFVTSLCFLAYVVLIAWAVRSLVPGTPRAAPRSRWSLLLECLLHPVSVNTINQANDFEVEPDDGMELLIERLAMPNLWLTPMVPTDYLRYLPTWKFQGWFFTCAADRSIRASTSDCSIPTGMIPSSECAICLEKYKTQVVLCGLPCGHHFHEGCIMAWLQRDNHHCPICRWPAYRCK